MKQISDVEALVIDSCRELEYGTLYAEGGRQCWGEERILSQPEWRLVLALREYCFPATITVVKGQPAHAVFDIQYPAGLGKKQIKLF